MLLPSRSHVWALLLIFTITTITTITTALAQTTPPTSNHAALLSQLGPATAPRSWDESYTLAEELVRELTTAEKILLTTGTGIALGPCSGNTQRVQRVGFPYLCLQDGPVGPRGVDFVDVFPAGITTGATWDKELFYIRARALGAENRVKGVNVALAPVAGPLGRAPAAGRNWEGFGADPYLQGVANAQSVRGLQDEKVIACAKHWVANEQEHFRMVLEDILVSPITKSISSNVEERTLKELYEWPFMDAVEAGAGSIMCSYNRVNEEYSCESSTLLREHLKGNATSGGLGFQGFVVTDWFASATASKAAPAGVDMVMPGDAGLTGDVAALLPASDGAMANGTRLDEMVTRTVAAWYKMNQDVSYPNISFDSWDTDEDGVLVDRGYVGQINFHVPANTSLHAEIVRTVAAEGTTLLKNTNNALPLDDSLQSIGVFGDDAGPIPGGPNSCGDYSQCSNGTLAIGWGSGSGTFPYLVDPLQAVEAKAATIGASVENVLDNWDMPRVAVVAEGKDACLVFINSRSGENTNEVEGNAGDRNNLTAWDNGDVLVNTVAKTCSNTIVIIHSVGPIIMEPWIDNANVTAVVMAHLPGQESGNSLVDVLWGDVNPSGKLPYTVAKNETDYCCQVQYTWEGFEPQQNFSENLLVDYKWFDMKGIEPRFEFGFGLSYTNFTYDSTLTFTTPESTDSLELFDPVFNVTTTITNNGNVTGKEVAQLYLTLPDTAPSGTPVRQLRGFEKVSLETGESQEATFTITKRDLSYWSESESAWVVAAGEVGVAIGASSRDFRASGTVTVA